MKPKTAIIILSFLILLLLISFSVILIKRQSRLPIEEDGSIDLEQDLKTDDYHNLSEREAERLKILEVLNEKKANEIQDPAIEAEKEQNRLEILDELNKEKEEEIKENTISPEEREKQRLEILNQLNSNK